MPLVAATASLVVLLLTATLPGASAASPAPTSPSRTALDGRLHEILSRPDYRQASQGEGFAPGAALRWLWLQVTRLLQRLSGLQETNYGLFLVAVITGLAVLIPLLAHIAYTFARFLRRRPVGEGASGEAAPARRPATSADLVREAEAHARAGRYREAIRSLYLAMVRELQVRGVLPRVASQTNWEHLAHLGSLPDLAAYVRPFTQVFDEKWYGGRPSDAADVARCREWLEAVFREVESA